MVAAQKVSTPEVECSHCIYVEESLYFYGKQSTGHKNTYICYWFVFVTTTDSFKVI